MAQTKLTDSDKGDTAAHGLAKKQQEISVSQFFEKNRHLLGFDNKKKALMTTIKEAVDNSLDACEEASIAPEISVEVIDMNNSRFRVIIEDNGPGIVRKQIPNIFAKLLYGSKFHSMKQQRGQQGIGISAAVLYGQLTTGRSAKIVSKIGAKYPAHSYELHINTQQNRPEIVKDETIEWNKDHGTKIEIDLEASYQQGNQSIDEYLKETSIVNPHATIIYTNPKAEQIIFPRATQNLPAPAKDIKPHPYGIELGMLINMLKATDARSLQSFLSTEFTRVGSGTAKEICKNASVLPNTKPKDVTREIAEKLFKGIQDTKLMAPPTDCISPIGAELLEKGLKKEVNAEYYATTSRRPAVYRGNPFVIEIGIAYGGQQEAEGQVRLMRFANRVPLLYQFGACAITKSVIQTLWRSYGLSQSKGSLPIGPCTILVHIASVWVPFTSESKEAIAHYPDIVKEMKLALQDCGRQIGSYVNKKKRIHAESAKRDYIEMFIPHVADALKDLLGFKDKDKEKTEELLREILEKQRGKLEDIKFDPKKNDEYDEELSSIGKGGEDIETVNIEEDKSEEKESKRKEK
jgi:DNA topoisomerase VI subunit B